MTTDRIGTILVSILMVAMPLGLLGILAGCVYGSEALTTLSLGGTILTLGTVAMLGAARDQAQLSVSQATPRYDGAESVFDGLLDQPEQLRSVAEQVCDLAAECMRRQGDPDEECEIVSRAGAILAGSLQARLTESRIGRKDGRRLLVPAGTVVDITGIDPAGRMTAAYHGTRLSVSQDQASPIYDEEVSPMRIAIVEAGADYSLRIADIEAELTGDTTQELVEQAKAEVAKRGYRVMPGPEAESPEGGCCEYCQEIDAYGNVKESIAITVYPEPARE